MEEWGSLILLAGVIVAAVAAIAAWRSSKAAGKSVEATKNTVKAQIVMLITGTYGSEKMFESIKKLHDWRRGHGEKFAEVFGSRLKEKGHTDAEQLDGDRRRVSHFFHQIRAMLDCEVVDENFVKKLIKSNQVDTLLDVVEPLAKAKDPEYDHSTFDTFRRIYRGGKDNEES